MRIWFKHNLYNLFICLRWERFTIFARHQTFGLSISHSNQEWVTCVKKLRIISIFQTTPNGTSAQYLKMPNNPSIKFKKNFKSSIKSKQKSLSLISYSSILMSSFRTLKGKRSRSKILEIQLYTCSSTLRTLQR